MHAQVEQLDPRLQLKLALASPNIHETTQGTSLPGTTHYVVQVHYNNVNHLTGEQDTSGFGTYGKSWLTVAAVPQADLTAGIPTGAGSTGSASSSGKQQDIYSANSQGVGVSSQEVLNALLGSGKTVHGAWGTGTLVTTSLFSMLITGGEVYIGAVEPSVLYAAVGHTTS